MFKIIIALLLAFQMSFVYAYNDQRVSCEARAALYTEIVKFRNDKQYSEAKILSGLGSALLSRGVSIPEVMEILDEGKKVYENKNLVTEKDVLVKYLSVCGGTEI